MKEQFEREGMRRTVFAVMLVLERNFPHVLLLKASRAVASLSNHCQLNKFVQSASWLQGALIRAC